MAPVAEEEPLLFIVGKKSRKPSTHLFTLKQKSREPLKDYISRFNEEALQVDDYSDKMVLSAMISKLREGRFLFLIGKNPPSTLGEFISHAQKYMNAEEFFTSRKGNQTSKSSSKGKRQAGQREKCKYCRLHRNHGHNTNDRIDLKEEIKTLICKGHLRQYVKEERQTRKEDLPRKATDEAMEIRIIFDGPSNGGDLNQARKAYSRSTDPELHINSAERPRKELRVSPCNLTFIEDDARGIQHPHDDALEVTMTIANYKVYRVLVDTRISTDILYSEAFDKMAIDRSRFRPVKTPLHGFVGDKVISKGDIFLLVTAGEGRN
ncbi:uncharacterized protein LOC131250728 [Magnolia sinica]|uniref:uncharacterized protein LOC131250728 n=1 Tax=Magnolia sinica TaxID=86752 RepID=UPI002658F81A|nr:uncharacterized protein LOC131250728 [Magnolia sinica]